METRSQKRLGAEKTKSQRPDGNMGPAHERMRDQSYIRQFNIQSVLSILQGGKPVSRTDIARLTGMSPTSVTRIVSVLLEQGLIHEIVGEQRAGRGRKAASISVNDEGLYSVGIHLDGSVVRMCLIDFACRVLYRREMLVDGALSPEQFAEAAWSLFQQMPDGAAADRSRIGAVGVCLSGAVNSRTGVVIRSYQMNWFHEDVGRAFSERFGMPACIENDVKACLIGEKVRMEIPEETDTAYLMIGAGLGLACTCGGALLRGHQNEAGEIARMPLGQGEEDDFLSAHLAESHIIRRAQRFDPSVHTMEAIVWAKRQGHAWAGDMLKDFERYLKLVLNMTNAMYDPARIILGGSMFGRLSGEIDGTLSEILAAGRVCMGASYEESCMMGAAVVGLRGAVVDLIGQRIEN